MEIALTPHADIIATLRRTRDEQALIVAREQQKLAQLDEALSALEDTVVINDVPVRQDFKHMGILESTSRLLDEVGRPMSTREIADAIRLRGVQTRSKSFIPTVYATLANSPMFVRERNNWTLKKGRRQSAA